MEILRAIWKSHKGVIVKGAIVLAVAGFSFVSGCKFQADRAEVCRCA